MSMSSFAIRFGALAAVAALSGNAAWAQAPQTSAGPGRITCTAITKCDLGVGTPPSIRYKVDASALPDADKARLTKQCTAKAPPCIATVDGTDNGTIVKAAKIKFFN